MGILKGQLEYQRFLKGERLTRGDAMLAQCYVCNGGHEGEPKDCGAGGSCPLYPWFPYQADPAPKRVVSEEHREAARERMAKMRGKSARVRTDFLAEDV